MLAVYGFRLMIFRSFGQHLSKRSVNDNIKVRNYNVSIQIDSEIAHVPLGELHNFYVMQRVCVVQYSDCDINNIFGSL